MGCFAKRTRNVAVRIGFIVERFYSFRQAERNFSKNCSRRR